MHVKIIGIILLFSSHLFAADFYELTNLRWSAGVKLSFINKHYNNIEKITEPKGTTQAIFEVEFLDAQFNKAHDCLIYSIPAGDDFGHLKIIANPLNQKCEDIILEKAYAELKTIRNFTFEMKEEVLRIKVDTKDFIYTFLNFRQNKENKILSHSIPKTLIVGLEVASSIDYHLTEKVLADGELCFDIDDDCKILKENQCDQCQGGSYSVLGSKCEKQKKKFCGVDRCGEKNQPACSRGTLASGISMTNYCINGSPLGFCNKGLNVVCINNTLICE